MKKWIIALIAVVGLLWIGAWVAAKKVLSEESLVRLIEKKITSRVQLDALDWGFRGLSVKVTAHGLVLAERDHFADESVPLAERPQLSSGEVEIERLSFDVSLPDLFSENIAAHALVVDRATVKIRLYENGENSLEGLFGRPEKKQKRRLNAHDHKDWVTAVKSVDFKNLKLIVMHEKSKLKLASDQLHLKLRDIRIDPNQLEQINTANITLMGSLVLSSQDGAKDYARIALDCQGRAKVFRAEDGDLDPDAELRLRMASGSYVSSKIPVVDKVFSKTEGLKKVGIRLPKLPEQWPLSSDEVLAARYYQHTVTVLKEATLGGDGSFIRLQKDSWFKLHDEQHEATFLVHLDSKYAQALTQKISKKKGGLLGAMSQRMFSGKGLSLRVRSRGTLSDPEVELLGDWSWVNGLNKDHLKKRLQKEAGSLLEKWL